MNFNDDNVPLVIPASYHNIDHQKNYYDAIVMLHQQHKSCFILLSTWLLEYIYIIIIIIICHEHLHSDGEVAISSWQFPCNIQYNQEDKEVFDQGT